MVTVDASSRGAFGPSALGRCGATRLFTARSRRVRPFAAIMRSSSARARRLSSFHQNCPTARVVDAV